MRLRDNWVVGIILLISLTATGLSFAYEKRQAFARNQAAFDRASLVIQDDLTTMIEAYGQFMRGGVALFNVSDDVNREEFRSYVESVRLTEKYPGIQGISFNPILRGAAEKAAHESAVRRKDLPDYTVIPAGDRDVYAPVQFIEPMNVRNERALGFDIYSESNRRAAAQQAIVDGSPSLTSKLKLVQEDANGELDLIQAGVLLVFPVYFGGNTGSDPDGLIVSVFRMGDLMQSISEHAGNQFGSHVNVTLYDGATATPDNILYATPNSFSAGSYRTEGTLRLFNKEWLFETTSTQTFDESRANDSSIIILGAGILVSLLLTSLAWGQAARNLESRRATAKLTASNARIEFLMREINHRSKNLLSLVLVIARQTGKGDPSQFASSFSERLRALATSQDLLVKSRWREVALDALLHSQLSHFADLIGTRIHIVGDHIGLSAANAQTLGMAIHELATNASKYGALANDTGTILITWEEMQSDNVSEFRMSWVERNGPPITAPESSGFGVKVSETMVKIALAGVIETKFDPAGFEWHLLCPLDRIHQSEDADLSRFEEV